MKKSTQIFWNFARMVGDMPLAEMNISEAPLKQWNAVFEGVAISITENANVQFQDGHSYSYSTFKTENPSSKVNGMGLGLPPFDISDTPN